MPATSAVSVEKLKDEYLKTNPNTPEILEQVAGINERLEFAQRTIAKPVVYHFIVRSASK